MKMKYNTRGVTNPMDSQFTGCYGGVDLVLLPGETRWLPSTIAQHVAGQLAEYLFKKQDRRNPKNVIGVPQILNSILGDEIITKDRVENLSLADEIRQHEEAYARFVEAKRREDLLRDAEKV